MLALLAGDGGLVELLGGYEAALGIDYPRGPHGPKHLLLRELKVDVLTAQSILLPLVLQLRRDVERLAAHYARQFLVALLQLLVLVGVADHESRLVGSRAHHLGRSLLWDIVMVKFVLRVENFVLLTLDHVEFGVSGGMVRGMLPQRAAFILREFNHVEGLSQASLEVRFIALEVLLVEIPLLERGDVILLAASLDGVELLVLDLLGYLVELTCTEDTAVLGVQILEI